MTYIQKNLEIDVRELNNQNFKRYFRLKTHPDSSKQESYWHKIHSNFTNFSTYGQLTIMMISHKNF